MMVTFGYGSIVTFIVIFGEERGIDQIFLFYLVNAIMASVSRLVTGKWFDQRGPKGLVSVCPVITFIGRVGFILCLFQHSNYCGGDFVWNWFWIVATDPSIMDTILDSSKSAWGSKWNVLLSH